VLPLARHFLALHAAEDGRSLTLSAQAEAALQAHDWPGNVRELSNAIERAAVLTRGPEIGPEGLLLDAPRPAIPAGAGTLQEALDRAAAERIRAALKSTGGRKAEAAAQIGIDRTTLFRLMKKLDLG